jgi:hypothetical protein
LKDELIQKKSLKIPKYKKTNHDLQNNTHKTKDRVTGTSPKPEGELRYSGRVGRCCSTCDTCRVNLVINPVISHDWGKDREMLTKSGTYPWSFVTQIFHNGQLSHGGDLKLSKWWLQPNLRRTFGSVASLLAATLYQGNPDRNHKLWNILWAERYILHMQVLPECCYIWMESSQWENWNNFICRKVSFFTTPHCQFRCVGHVMKQTYLYVWHTLFQAQWDRCDQRNHQI